MIFNLKCLIKIKYVIILFLLFSLPSFSQVPQGIPYQAIARNISGNALVNQAVSVRFSVLNGGPTGSAVYVETHTITTNAFGLFTLTVGSGTSQIGTFS